MSVTVAPSTGRPLEVTVTFTGTVRRGSETWTLRSGSGGGPTAPVGTRDGSAGRYSSSMPPSFVTERIVTSKCLCSPVVISKRHGALGNL